MAVGTILCASYWSAWSAREAAVEQDKLLKVGRKSFSGIWIVFSFHVIKLMAMCIHYYS